MNYLKLKTIKTSFFRPTFLGLIALVFITISPVSTFADVNQSTTASCVAGVNMIANGSFENPKLTIPWGSVNISTPDFSWTSNDTVVYPFVEVQAGYTEGSVQWLPHTGTQYAEIDGGTNHDVSQVLSTIPGNTYTLSYWTTPRPNLSTTTNIMNVSVNGQIIDSYTAEGSLMTTWANRTFTFTATTSVTRLSFIQGQDIHKGEGMFLDDVSVTCNPVNHAPIITRNGADTLTVFQGSLFVDPGVTASDTEDGNISNHIVVTGTVDTSILGTTTLTYSITDSGGSTTKITRTVVVVPVSTQTPTNACVISSDTTTLAGNVPAVLTYNQNSAWTASIPGSQWIWSSYKVTDPIGTTTVVFSKTFTATSTLPHAILSIAADNSYIVKVNGTVVAQNIGEFNYSSVATYDIASAIVSGTNTITFEVANFAQPFGTPEMNPAGLLYKLDLTSGCAHVPPVTNTFCPETGELTYPEFASARLAGMIDISLDASTSTGKATARVINRTGCVIPMSLSSYKVFDQVLSHQEFFSGTGLVSATSSTVYDVKLPACMAQIDFWYGLAPQVLLDSNPYGGPSAPVVVDWKFIYNNGYSYGDASGQFCTHAPVNTPPTITLIGSNPFNINTGDTFTDPGATATDLEDGNATTTAHIIVTGTVATSTPGSYTLTYTVTDSGGLTASTTRTVVVSTPTNGGGNSTGSITFCAAFADLSNVLATSSVGLPAGNLSLTLGTTTNIQQSLIQSPSWTMSSFAPNRHVILSTTNDVQCVTYSNLPFGDYYYSVASTTGSALQSVKYNDQYDTPVNGIFDFFNYSPALFTATTTDDASRNFNSDGLVTLNVSNTSRTLVMLATFDPRVKNTPPTITLIGSNPFNINTGDTFTDPGATATDLEDGNATTTAHIIVTGTVATSTPGSYTLTYTVTDSGGLTASTTRTVVVSTPTVGSGCTSNCGGGGGGGGGNGPIVGSLPTGNGGGNGPIVTPVITSSVPNACNYLYDYLHIGWNNSPVEVKKLQVFLRDLEGHTNVTVNGIYDEETVKAVNEFQVKYGNDILVPWDGTYHPSSFTYILTKKKVNEIYCKTAFPITVQEQSVIDAYRNFVNDLNTNNVEIVPPTVEQLNPTPVTTGEIGIGHTVSTSSVNLAIGGPNSSTTRAALTNFAAAVLAFPMNWMKGIISPNQCLFSCSAYCKWIDALLIALLIAIIYVIIRKGTSTKKIEEINKELDLK